MPPNAGPDPGAFLASVACFRAGSCVAAGDYADSAGAQQVVLVAESGGRWHRGTEIRLPSDAAASPLAAAQSVSCTSAGSCVAIGSYRATSRPREAFAVTGSPRGWGHAIKVSVVPANAASNARPFLDSVACTRPGSCVASGDYTDQASGLPAMAAHESGGTWRRAVEIMLPANAMTGAGVNASLRAVSCTSAGYCVAVGNYRERLGGVRDNGRPAAGALSTADHPPAAPVLST